MFDKTKIIVIDGVDGCGKSTLVAQLKEKLIEKGFKVATASQFETSITTQKNHLLDLKSFIDTNYRNMHPQTVVSLYVDSTVDVLFKLEQYIREGNHLDFIIFDRLYICNVVHGYCLYDKFKIKNKHNKDIDVINNIGAYANLINKMYTSRFISQAASTELNSIDIKKFKYFYIDTSLDRLVGRAVLRNDKGDGDNIVSTDRIKINNHIQNYKEFIKYAPSLGYDVTVLDDFCDQLDENRFNIIFDKVGV